MFQKITLSILSAFLLFISWPPLSQFTFFIFLALVPLFVIESCLHKKEITLKSYYIYVYLAFFLFNLCATFWIKNAHFGGAVFAILCNSFFMATVFFIYVKVKSVIKWKYTFFILPIFWIGFEYLHLNWDLSWPWLTLGNVFSSHPNWVQWYSATGVLGGTLWIFIVNRYCFNLYQSRKKRYIVFLLLALIVPLILSKKI